MEKYDDEKKKLSRHIRYIYSKDSKRKLIYYGLEPQEDAVVSMNIEELIELKLALESLTDMENMIVQNNIVGSETLVTISNRLNISLATVKRIKRTALLKLREYLK